MTFATFNVSFCYFWYIGFLISGIASLRRILSIDKQHIYDYKLVCMSCLFAIIDANVFSINGITSLRRRLRPLNSNMFVTTN